MNPQSAGKYCENVANTRKAPEAVMYASQKTRNPQIKRKTAEQTYRVNVQMPTQEEASTNDVR